MEKQLQVVHEFKSLGETFREDGSGKTEMEKKKRRKNWCSENSFEWRGSICTVLKKIARKSERMDVIIGFYRLVQKQDKNQRYRQHKNIFQNRRMDGKKN